MSAGKKLYNAVFTAGFMAAAPFYFLKMWRRGNWRAGFGQRFGRYGAKLKQSLTNRHVLWLHAVSVGEVNLCTQLIAAIEPAMPNLKIVVSTTTSTGMAELQRKLPSHIAKIYFPVDRRAWVSRAMAVLHPDAIVLVEAEIWPNFLWRARESHIPVFLVNARLSPKSFQGYKRFRFLFGPLFGSLKGVGVQNEADAQRLRELGCAPEAVQVVGNLKFDSVRLDDKPPMDAGRLLRQLGVAENQRVLVAGSTHAGEEALLAEIFIRLKKQFTDLFLVLVPRHFERGREVGEILKRQGLRFVYRTELSVDHPFEPNALDCLLVNTTGELKQFYKHATVAFVGKSLTAEGGQNPIEPAAEGKAVVFGPNMQNFASIAEAFVRAGAAVQVRDAEELEATLTELLQDAERRMELGRKAIRVVQENRGAIQRTVSMIARCLDAEEIYVAPEFGGTGEKADH